MATRPKLSVAIPARGGLDEAEAVIDALRPQAESAGLEVIISGGPPADAPADWIRIFPSEDKDILRLRLRAIQEARGEIIAIGEDHAVPTADWCAAVLRAHEENPSAPAIVGCLANATDSTTAGRANFLAFAAPWQPPVDSLYPERSPPSSAVSYKRETVADIHEPGDLEMAVLLGLHGSGSLVADGRVVLDHHQDHGIRWSVRNGFDNTRCLCGYASRSMSRRQRLRSVRTTVPNLLRRPMREARAGRRSDPGAVRDLATVAIIALAAAIGGAAGIMLGPGASAERVA
jgi:hypothetical protein